MTLDEAVTLARRFHEGAVDKAGEPYIGHPLRVMARVSTDEERLAAVLHDLLEDTDLSATDLLAAGCPPRVLRALDALTRRPDETYDEFIERVVVDPLAVAVKRADIADNLDPDRLARLAPDRAAALRAKYHRAWERLATADAGTDVAGAPDPPPSGPYARFDCATCAHPAGRVELRAATLVVTSRRGTASVAVEGGDVVAAVTAADAGALYRLDPRFAPFWCPACERCSCDRHSTEHEGPHRPTG